MWKSLTNSSFFHFLSPPFFFLLPSISSFRLHFRFLLQNYTTFVLIVDLVGVFSEKRRRICSRCRQEHEVVHRLVTGELQVRTHHLLQRRRLWTLVAGLFPGLTAHLLRLFTVQPVITIIISVQDLWRRTGVMEVNHRSLFHRLMSRFLNRSILLDPQLIVFLSLLDFVLWGEFFALIDLIWL